MAKKFIIAAAIIAIGGVAVIALARGDHGMKNTMSMSAMSESGTQSSSHQHAQATNSVSIEDYAFSPAAITVKTGTTVTWTNNDTVHHTVTIDGGGDGPNSGEFNKGQTYTYTFKTAGTYKYICKIHPSMHGTVIVTN